MERVIIVSNRLPLSIQPEENDEIQVKPSVGGLATGMKSFYKDYDSVWIGWPGLNREEVGPKLEENIRHELDKEKCFPVFLEEELIELYYGGFSNKTIWPLFHYFTQYTEYEKDTWEAYVKVNEIFADNVLQNIKGGETIWVHDYHLLLLPKMIKDKRPDVTIGFFLHIPFPSYEVFRILPWRNQLINGMLGADLIGFHTFDYARHFMSSIRRLLGYDINFNQIDLKTRIAKAEAFPMGIDYDKFHNAAVELTQKSVKDKSKLHKEIEKYFLMSPEQKLILSIDRLDYTKEIPHRLLAFEKFLETYPEYREKITLVMLCVPSRTGVEQYQIMKNEVDQLVGRINGCFGSINWTPIWYFYRSMPFENLIELYNSCDIALITPVRDGMNLVAKEYIASKTDQKGVLILSEMAGASREMSEALIINPNNMEEVAEAIKDAINMPEEEQIERNTILQERLKRYNVVRWAHDFIDSLINVSEFQKKLTAKKITAATIKKIRKDYQKAKKRIFFLDYNGTLINYKKNPQKAKPDQELLNLLDQLALDKNNNIVLISGWDRDTFNAWFKNKDYHMITEHGSWIK
ncbi:MAG: bifunctional alpha,alpha-trehalose-phosphate synthase (UDP-forming)/trehalose-phosphatase, partial [bacterium]